MIIELNKQLAELKVTVDGLEKERDFYFGKLRDIEILVQEQLDDLEAKGQAMNGDAPDAPVLKDIQAVLYSTEVKYFFSFFHLFICLFGMSFFVYNKVYLIIYNNITIIIQ